MSISSNSSHADIIHDGAWVQEHRSVHRSLKGVETLLSLTFPWSTGPKLYICCAALTCRQDKLASAILGMPQADSSQTKYILHSTALTVLSPEAALP